MEVLSRLSARLAAAVDRRRLLDTAVQLIAVRSPTGEAGAASDCLSRILAADGFGVERPAAGHPAAPAVVVRFDSGRPGRTLQFNGHLDTVHLPFVPPAMEGGRLTGSGTSDMKGGTAAAVEALRVLHDTGALSAGAVLLTAHDLHEAPWGLGQQLDRLIADGCVGDGVLLPEPLCDQLPAVGRGALTWKAAVRRREPPCHEVMRAPGAPDVIAAGAELALRLGRLDRELSSRSDPLDPLHPRRIPAGPGRPADDDVSAGARGDQRLAVADGAEGVRGRRQQFSRAARAAGHHARPAGRRAAHRPRVGGDRRPGAGGPPVRPDGGRLLRSRLSKRVRRPCNVSGPAGRRNALVPPAGLRGEKEGA